MTRRGGRREWREGRGGRGEESRGVNNRGGRRRRGAGEGKGCEEEGR